MFPKSGVKFGSRRGAGWCFLNHLFLAPSPPHFSPGYRAGFGPGSGKYERRRGRGVRPGAVPRRQRRGIRVSGGAQASGGAGPRRGEASGNRRGGLSPTLLGHRRIPFTQLPFRRPGWSWGAGAERPRARYTSGGRFQGLEGPGSRDWHPRARCTSRGRGGRGPTHSVRLCGCGS